VALVSNAYDPRFFDLAGRASYWLTRLYFRARVRGLDRLPPGPCLLVANHSALGTIELLCLLGGFHAHFGRRRRFVGLAHDLTVGIPIMGHFYRAVGAVTATRENGLAALRAGHDVIVFPGGDLDACRPFYQPREVFFGERRGYIRLALEAGVPIVPLATIGSHYTWLMAPGGRALARAPFVRRFFRTDCVPLPMGPAVAVAAAVAAGVAHVIPWTLAAAAITAGLLPTPARVTTEALPPIDVADATAHVEGDGERVEAGHALVYGALRHAVANMAHRKPYSAGDSNAGVVA
jgi:1-acyl-sn-glycerol-3-phosphate acyltransferase